MVTSRLYVTMVALLLFLPSICHGQTTLRAGVASMITPVSAVRYYQQVVKYLGQKMGMQAEMVHRTTYDEIDIMLEEEAVDVAFICSSPYVLNNEKFGAELLVAPLVNGKTTYQSNIIVHKDSAVESFEEMEGKSFVFVDPKSNTGRLYPTYLLAKKHTTPQAFFSNYMYSYSHNKSVEIVAKNKVDGAAVDSIVYNYMVATNSPYAAQTKVIKRSQHFGIPPVVVSPNLPTLLKSALRQIFLNMHNDSKGRTILDGMKIEKFVEVPDSNYDSIRAMRSFNANYRTTPDQRHSAQKTQPERVEKIYHFGILPRDNPRISYERYQPLIDYLTVETGEQFELKLERDYKSVVNSLGTGKSSFALLGPLTYLDASQRFDAIPIAKSLTAQKRATSKGVIVTSAQAEISKLSDLTGKRFAFGSLWSTSGNLMPRYMLAWSGIHLNQLSDYDHFNYHETVSRKVISGEFDAGAVRESVADTYLEYGLKKLSTSRPIPTGPVVVTPETPHSMVRRVQNALLSMHSSTHGRETLKKLDYDMQGGFIGASDTDYMEIRNMINKVFQACGKGCHPKRVF
ncbi:MAG: phosphate/phosphite/phosphonate ABC transporter substrate-binding protein [Desulfopila sp.]